MKSKTSGRTELPYVACFVTVQMPKNKVTLIQKCSLNNRNDTWEKEAGTILSADKHLSFNVTRRYFFTRIVCARAASIISHSKQYPEQK